MAARRRGQTLFAALLVLWPLRLEAAAQTTPKNRACLAFSDRCRKVFRQLRLQESEKKVRPTTQRGATMPWEVDTRISYLAKTLVRLLGPALDSPPRSSVSIK
jgi:uncharacterized membrane protein